jgi:putative ABC transport system ATP-binding protein
MKKPIIKLENVEKVYHVGESAVNALSGVNVEINKGEFVAIIGPSGSGKSTMMNMVGALDVPSLGKVLLDGTDISKLHESELAQIRGKKIGFVFQTFHLIPTLTAKENVALPMMFQMVDSERRIKKAEEILKKVGLGNRMEHLPNELSGGQKQRIAIARALVNNPEVILADEPTGNLDSKTGKEIMDIFNNLNKEGRTIIIVTHDKDIARKASKVLKIVDGRIYNGKK